MTTENAALKAEVLREVAKCCRDNNMTRLPALLDHRATELERAASLTQAPPDGAEQIFLDNAHRGMSWREAQTQAEAKAAGDGPWKCKNCGQGYPTGGPLPEVKWEGMKLVHVKCPTPAAQQLEICPVCKGNGGGLYDDDVGGRWYDCEACGGKKHPATQQGGAAGGGVRCGEVASKAWSI